MKNYNQRGIIKLIVDGKVEREAKFSSISIKRILVKRWCNDVRPRIGKGKLIYIDILQ